MIVWKSTIFRNSSFGVIPSEWQVSKLADLSEHITKGTTPTTLGFKYTESGVNFVKVESIGENGALIFKNIQHISEQANQALMRSILFENDILFSIAGAIGRVTVVKKSVLPANTNQALAIIRIKDKNLNLVEYLKYFLMSYLIQDFVKTIAIQSQQANINLPNVGDLTIFLPPLEEQKGIVEVISCVDLVIQKTNEVIAKTKLLKSGLTKSLLTKGLGHKIFRDTEIGKIPIDWEVSEIGKLVETQYGYRCSIPKEKMEKGIKIISTADISKTGILNLDSIRRVDVQNSKVMGFQISKGDLLFNWRNAQIHVGKTALVDFSPDEGMIFASFLIRLKCGPRINNRFLFLLLNFLKDSGLFQKLSRRAVNQANFNAEELKRITIALPEISEQESISNILSIAEKKLELEIKQKEKLQQIKRGLMDLLLTGKVRVKVD